MLLTGTCTTSGTAVTFSSGSSFTGAWAGLAITINAIGYTVSSVGSATALTLTGSAGVQASPVTFSISVPGGAGSGTCTTSSSGDTVTYVSGTNFETSWVALIININDVNYTVSTVNNNGLSLTLNTSPGNQASPVPFYIMEAGTVNGLQAIKVLTEEVTGRQVIKTRISDAVNPSGTGLGNYGFVG